jgi:hypothetical protein
MTDQPIAVSSQEAQIAQAERTIDTVVAEHERERQDIADAVVQLRDTAHALQQERITALGRIRDRRLRIREVIRRMQLLDDEHARQETEVTASIKAGMVAAALADGDLI